MRNFIASYVRSRSAWSAARYVSLPKRSQSSITRFSPARQPATIAKRSARFISGLRTLLRIRRRTSSCTSPRSTILSGGMMIPSSKIVFAPGRQRAGKRPARVHLVTELRRPADELVLVEDRHEHEPVVRVRDRRRALERVGGEDHVARVDAPIPVLHHLVDVGPELPHDHAATRVGDHRELVVLLPDHGAHRGAEEHRVHLVPRALQRALDDVERDRDRSSTPVGISAIRGFSVVIVVIVSLAFGLIRMLKLTSTSAA